MQINDILAQKKQLRAHYLARRASLSAEQKAMLDADICREILSHPAFLACDTLLCFSPVRDEPDFTVLYQAARKQGITTAFPRCVGTQMFFHVVTKESCLTPGRFGIPTPHEGAPLAACSARTLCLLPALAAAKDGTRLGYGGGFYDRFLASFPGTTLLPIYSMLICDSLPREETDIAASQILTEKGVLS